MLIIAHLINRLPSQVLGFKSPNNLTPKIFGYVLFVHIHAHNKGKLDPRALKCNFIEYSSTQKGYKYFF